MCIWIILIMFISIGIFTYLIMLGASMNETDLERMIEDKEQIEYLKIYEVRRKKKNGK